MLLAGIDEAGYGPILGPLTVGCCVLEVPTPDDAVVMPCAWKLLRRIASKTRDASGKKLHIHDSKKVYSPSTGLTELEQSMLVLTGLMHGAVPDDLDAALALLAPDCVKELVRLPWYRAFEGESFPVEVEALSLKLKLNGAKPEFARAGVRVVELRAHVVDEQRLNRYFAATRNKSATSFTFVATHLDRLLREHTRDDELVIFCDRQGGKEHYGPDLRRSFEDWHLEITSETPKRAEYRLTNGPRSARLIFAEKGESECMSVAIASMLAKYLRETLMGRFNAFWKQHMPDVAPTAGYWQDGQRFLRDIEPTCARLGIDPVTLARSR
ncbi:MAG: hypothetical protein QM770_22245 [Tepidisphaeraceae bacterium]